MAGSITISTLNNDTGVLATQNGMNGIAKAWVNFGGGVGNTAGTVVNSFNVSSVIVVSTGIYTVNFTTAFPNANYVSVFGMLGDSASTTIGSEDHDTVTKTTTSVRVLNVRFSSGSFPSSNVRNCYIAFFSS
jgi:hypothetical protein